MPHYNELSTVPDQVQFSIKCRELEDHLYKTVLFSPLESERPSLFKSDTQIYHQHPLFHKTKHTVTKLHSKTLFLTGVSGCGKSALLRKASEKMDEVDITNTYLQFAWNDGMLTFDDIVQNFREHTLIDPDNDRTEVIEKNILDKQYEACSMNSPCRLTRGGVTPVFHHYFIDSDVQAFVNTFQHSCPPFEATEGNTVAERIYTTNLIFAFHHIYIAWFKQIITMDDGIGCYTSTTNNPLRNANIITPNCHNVKCDSEWSRYWIKRELITTYCYTEFARRIALIFPLLLNTSLSSNEMERKCLMKVLDDMFWTLLKKVMDNLVMTDVEERVVNFKRFKTLGFQLDSKFEHFFLTEHCILDVLLSTFSSGIIDQVFNFKVRPTYSNTNVAFDSTVGNRIADIAQVYKMCKVCMWVSDFFWRQYGLSQNDEIFLCIMDTTQTISIQNVLSSTNRKREHEVKQFQTESGVLRKLKKPNVFLKNSNYGVQLKNILCINPISQGSPSPQGCSQRDRFDAFVNEAIEADNEESLPPNFVKTVYQFYKLDPEPFSNFDRSIEDSFVWLNELLSRFPEFKSYIREDMFSQCFGGDFLKSSRLSAYRSLHQNNVRIGDKSINFMQFVDQTWSNLLSLRLIDV